MPCAINPPPVVFWGKYGERMKKSEHHAPKSVTHSFQFAALVQAETLRSR
jgi:hypothetical protein